MHPDSAELTYLMAMERQQELLASADRGGSGAMHQLLELLRGALGR
jgi:hypothetical protein